VVARRMVGNFLSTCVFISCSYNAVVGRVTSTPTDQANVSTLVVSLERRGW
jgi:hypothetical protein